MSAVGWMLRRALSAVRASIGAQARADGSRDLATIRDEEKRAAHAAGKAYGRAFRAAELAYDLGHCHAAEGERRRMAAQLDAAASEASEAKELLAWAHLKEAADELRGID